MVAYSDNQLNGEFHHGSGISSLIALVFFSFLLIMVLSLPFLGEALTVGEYCIFTIGLILLVVLVVYSYRSLLSSKKSYFCDSYGIKEIFGYNENTIAWNDIANVDLYHTLGGSGELRIVLLDENGEKLLTVNTEHLRGGGRDLLDLLSFRLKPLFEKRAAVYLKGELHNSFSVIKDVLGIEGQQLLVEFPKNKKQIIPFSELKRVEWLPSCISGASHGMVIIEHSGGRIKLPQGIKGIQYLLYALKHQYNLSMVNPVRLPEVNERINSLRRKLGNKRLSLLAGGLLAVGMLIPLGVIGWSVLKTTQTTQIGKSVTAVVTEKNKNDCVTLEYSDAQEKHQKELVGLAEPLYKKIQVGDNIIVKVHPFMGKEIVFEGKRGMTRLAAIWLSVVCLAFSFVGVGLLLFSFIGVGAMKKELVELDVVPIIDSKTVAPSACTLGISYEHKEDKFMNSQRGYKESLPPTLPKITLDSSAIKDEIEDTLKEDVDEAEAPEQITTLSGESKTCLSCAKTIQDDYFLASGDTWCRTCRENCENVKKKLGFLAILRVFAFGLGAAMVGGGLWALIVIMTGYELGLIAILVGLIVGHSVKLGAGEYRGRLCQVLALMFTFIGLSYSTIPIMVNEYHKNPDKYLEPFKKRIEQNGKIEDSSNKGKETSLETHGDSVEKSITSPNIDDNKEEHLKKWCGSEDAVNSKISKKVDEKLPSSSQKLKTAKKKSMNIFLKLALVILLVILGVVLLFVAPILVYIIFLVTSPISAIFTAIALWEAWRINKIEKLQFQGPFKLGDEIDLDKADFDV